MEPQQPSWATGTLLWVDSESVVQEGPESLTPQPCPSPGPLCGFTGSGREIRSGRAEGPGGGGAGRCCVSLCSPGTRSPRDSYVRTHQQRAQTGRENKVTLARAGRSLKHTR